MTVDRPSVTAVSQPVRTAVLTSILLLALGACGGKDKKDGTTPGGGAGGGDVSGGGDMSDGGGGGGGDGGGPGGGGEGGEPGLRPPGVDLTPAQQQQQVAEHLKKGRTSNDPEVAIREAQLALIADETSVDAMVLLAHANYRKGFDDQAEDILDKALKRGGQTNKQAHFVMGLIYDRSERPEKAQAAYEAAIRIDPAYKSALMNVGVHYLKNKRWTDAVQVYERLTGELGYQSAAVWTNLASAYRGRSADFNATDINRRNELLGKAEAAYRKALATKKDYANAHYNLGLLYLDADPYPEAGGKDMERLKRLQRAKTHFADYRQQPGADQKLADEQVAVVQKLIDKEETNRKKAAERDAKKRAKEAADAKKAADKAKKGESADDDEGFQ